MTPKYKVVQNQKKIGKNGSKTSPNEIKRFQIDLKLYEITPNLSKKIQDVCDKLIQNLIQAEVTTKMNTVSPTLLKI